MTTTLPKALLNHETQHTGRYSSRVAVRLAVVVGLINLAVSVWVSLNAPNPLDELITGQRDWFVWCSLGVAWCYGAITAVGIAGELMSERHQALCLTALSNRSMTNGYIAGSLYRLRGVLLLLVGLMPVFVVGALNVMPHDLAAGRVFQCKLTHTLSPQQPCDLYHFAVSPEYLPGVVVAETEALLVIVFWLWGTALLAVVMGVALTFWFRRPLGAMLATALLIGAMGSFYYLFAFPHGHWMGWFDQPQLPESLLLAGIAWGLLIWFTRLAPHWLPRHS